MVSIEQIHQLLKHATKNDASDIHLSEGYPPIVRIDGKLQTIKGKKLEKQDLERVRRIHKSYTKRTGRPITKHEVKLMTQATETLCQYNYEIGGCLLQSIDTKKPYISDELKRLRGKMEDLGYARKSKLDADFRQIVSAELQSLPDVWHWRPLARQ